MRIAIHDREGQSVPIATALGEAGHELTMDGPTDAFLVDIDCDAFGYRETIAWYKEQGALVLLYPHGAGGVNLSYDGLYEPCSDVDGELATGPVVAEYYRRLGITRPVRVVGWSYCRQLPFRRSENVRRVTFAPLHPNGDGSMMDVHRNANVETYRRLLECPWELVVRHVGPLSLNGLWEDDRVFRYVEGKRDMSTCEIDSADAVVTSVGSYAGLAVARGCPTVIFNQEAPSNYGVEGEKPVPRARWAEYADLVLYPHDAADGPLEDVVAHAASDDAPILEWKRNWIGDPFDSSTVAQTIEEFVRDLRAGTAGGVLSPETGSLAAR